LDYPEINNSIEKTCGVKLSYDEYYSNAEFLRRKNEQNYDIMIFSDTVYNLVKNDIKRNNINLSYIANSYNPTIKEKYIKERFPYNILYFTHALTGFLWNPNIINISSNDSIFDIFKKAGSNLVVIIDDPVEAGNLIKLGLGKAANGKNILDVMNMKNIKKISQESNVYITNNFNNLYDNKSFAFSFTWSGEAIVDKNLSQKNYNFLIHPELSYISSDLIAQINNKNYVTCVTKNLTSKNIMNILQNKDYYFSPYADYSSVKNEEFKNIYMIFKKKLPKLKWINNVDKNSFLEMNKAWELIKAEVNK
jgi:hypothetical protein